MSELQKKKNNESVIFFSSCEEIQNYWIYIYNWLINQRLKRNEHNNKNFKRLSKRKGYLINILKKRNPSIKVFYEIFNGLYYYPYESVVIIGYMAKHNYNEEIISLLEHFLNLVDKRKRLS